MNERARRLWVRIFAGMLFLGLATSASLGASYAPRFDRPTLDSMLAPIALYPDRLLSQVLMAATYPDEIEDAARWIRARPGLSGDAAVRAADGYDWDPSVRSLLAFPLVLDTLADHLRWTQDLGEAFMSQREEVMDVIQFLRRRALEAGTLRSNEAIHVIDNGYAIVIEPSAPQTVYVPYYDPRVTYGSWWWPARPPMYWPRWSGYYAPPGPPSYFVWGPGVYLSSGFFFGNFAWSRREVRVVDVRPYYYPRHVVVERYVVPGRPAPQVEHRAPTPGVWRHDERRRFTDEARAARRVNEPHQVDGRDRPRAREDDRPNIAPRANERQAPPAARLAEPATVPQPAPGAPPNVDNAPRGQTRGRDEAARAPARTERRDDARREVEDRGRRGNEGPRAAPAPTAPPAARLAEPATPPQPAPGAAPNVDHAPRGQAHGRDRDDAARAAARAERRDDGRRDGEDRGRRGNDGPRAAPAPATPPRAAAAPTQPPPQADSERAPRRRVREHGD